MGNRRRSQAPAAAVPVPWEYMGVPLLRPLQRLLIVLCVLAVAAMLAWRWAPSPGGDDGLRRLRAGAALRVGHAVEAPHALARACGEATPGVAGAIDEVVRLASLQEGPAR